MFVVYSFLKEIFSPQGHDRVVTIKSRYFFYCESLVLSGFFILVYRGCNLVAHASIHVYCSLTSVSPDWIPPGTYIQLATIDSPCLSTIPLFIIIHLYKSHLKLLSCWVESTHPFAARVVDSHPSVLLHPSGGHNCLNRCRLQMFLKPQVWVEYGNRTREHQSGHQSSY